MDEDLLRALEQIEEREADFPVPEHHRTGLLALGPRINELFRGAEVAELLDPALVVLLGEDPPKIFVVERLVMVELLTEARAVAASSLAVKDKPILAVISDGQEGSAHLIPDPRVRPDWWKIDGDR